MAKAAKKRLAKLERRREDFVPLASKPGFRRPGSLNPKKR